MKILSANCQKGTVELKQWRLVHIVIRDNLPADYPGIDYNFGYEGLFDVVPKYFGMTRMYRDPINFFVTYEFTDEQWTMFVLRWA
jgi:hypothetical protein